MKIYVASAWSDWPRAAQAADALRAAGHAISHDWMALAKQYPDGEAGRGEEFEVKCAKEDLDGVYFADALLLLTPDRKDLGCGCYVELGAALMLNRVRPGRQSIVITGACRNRTVFMKLTEHRFETDAEGVAFFGRHVLGPLPRIVNHE